MNRLRFSDLLAAALCLFFAIALQIQITLFQTPDYLGLRINLADLLVPFAGLGILYSLARRQSLWPQWSFKHLYIWLGGLTLVLLAALVHTHFTYGEISRWALVNKFGGWIILLALLGAGGWLGTNAPQERINLFFKTFLYFALSVITIDLFIIVVQIFPFAQRWIHYDLLRFPIEGLMANRNAYATLYLAVLSLSLTLYFSNFRLVHQAYFYVLYFLFPFFLIFNASRAMMLVLCLLVPLFMIFNFRQYKKIGVIFLCALLGVATLIGIYHNKQHELLALRGKQLSFLNYLGETIGQDDPYADGTGTPRIYYPGDNMRLTILADAKEMVPMHPVIGSGLGSMLLFQKEKHGKTINLIDCTPLWLLVETGLIGMLAFIAFYFQSARALYGQWKQDEGFIKTLRGGIIVAMLCFSTMSVFHELLYTRFVWVLLALGLTMGVKTRRDV